MSSDWCSSTAVIEWNPSYPLPAMTMYARVYQAMQSAMGGLDAHGKPLYQDVHHWMESEFASPEAQLKLVQDLQDLEGQCRQILKLQPGDYVMKVPAKDSVVQWSGAEQHLKAMKFRVWQLDYRRVGQVKSGAALHAIRDCMHKNLAGPGNETAKYPAPSSACAHAHAHKVCVGLIHFLLVSPSHQSYQRFFVKTNCICQLSGGGCV